MKDFEYSSPESLMEACKLLKKYSGTAHVLAGGTDLLPQMYHHQLAPDYVINLKRIRGLNEITFDGSKGLTIGTLVTFNEIIYSTTIVKNYPILVEVSKKIASHQIRNLATIGGNLCNAAPSADSAPILIALDSMVTITNPNGKPRTIPLGQFFIGPGTTALNPGEILTQIHIPPIKPYSGMAYIKHSTRRALEIAIVGAAGLVQLNPESDKCLSARIVISACAPTPLRIPKAEDILVGKKIDTHLIEASAETAAAAVKPITDVRACDKYRREMTKVQCKRVLEEALARVTRNAEFDQN